MKRYLILFVFGCGLILCLYLIQQQTDKQEISASPEKQPIAYIDQNILDSINRPDKWHIDLPQSSQTVFKKTDDTDFGQPNTDKPSLFDYISIGQCQEDKHRPDYLDHKLNGTIKNGDKNASGGLKIPSCGFIRTKIPFSF